MIARIWRRVVMPASVVAQALDSFAHVVDAMHGQHVSGRIRAAALRAAAEQVKLCDDDDATVTAIAVVVLQRFPAAILALGYVAKAMNEVLDQTEPQPACKVPVPPGTPIRRGRLWRHPGPQGPWLDIIGGTCPACAFVEQHAYGKVGSIEGPSSSVYFVEIEGEPMRRVDVLSRLNGRILAACVQCTEEAAIAEVHGDN